MDFNDFLNPNKPLVIKTYKGGTIANLARMGVREMEDDEPFPSTPEEDDIDYAKDYQEKEAELYIECHKKMIGLNINTPLEEIPDIDQVEDPSASMVTTEVLERQQEELLSVYKKYPFESSSLKKEETPLVIDSYRDKIISMINVNSVVVIEGHTGCGKTTRVPDFILDDCYRNNRHCNIIVTQPRRIAAISVAHRVCDERSWDIGGVVGYRVALDSKTSSDTRLTYVTTRVLLHKLIKSKNMNEFTHIIIDEVHERTQDMDFLLVVVRKFLYTVSRSVKIILMSATFNTEEFSEYFRSICGSQLIPAPVIHIGKSDARYKTLKFYTNSIKSLFTEEQLPQYNKDQPGIPDSVYKAFVRLVRAFDIIDPVNVKLTDFTDGNIQKKKKIGHVLVFLPGIFEIEEAYDRLMNASKEIMFKSESTTANIKWHVLPLHSSITREEQRRVFDPPPEGMRKIILSTNIAESSITVPDIFYVIDFCLTKTMVANQLSQYPSLRLEWASHTNCIQRAGRVGRVSDGRVYRLVPNDFYEKQMSADITPEILRAPLEQLVLYAKMLDMNEPPKATLALCLNPPILANISNTIKILKEVGGLLQTIDGEYSSSDGDLTILGRIMARLPLDVRLSKFIVLGHIFGYLRQCIIMAAGLSIDNIFSTPFQQRLKGFKSKLLWADGSSSDLIAYLNLYMVYERNLNDGTFQRQQNVRQWAKSNFINFRAMKDWNVLVEELKMRLKSEGIQEMNFHANPKREKHEPLFLKVLICGAFYPNYFVRSSDGGQIDEKNAIKILGGRDPYSTVYFTNFENDQPGPLYIKSIKKMLQDCGGDMVVSFESSSKIFVQFINSAEPETITYGNKQLLSKITGKVKQEVYLACKKRQLKIPFSLPVLRKEEAWVRAKTLGIQEFDIPSSREYVKNKYISKKSILPTLDMSYIKIRISHIIDAGNFWVQYVDDQDTVENIALLDQLLNSCELKTILPNDIKVGYLYAAPFIVDGVTFYYRAKVLALNPTSREIMAKIFFIDYGNMDVLPISVLKALPYGKAENLPSFAMECILTEIRPADRGGHGTWSTEATQFMEELVSDYVLYGKVFSVVNGVISLDLFRNTLSKEQQPSKSINQMLIDNGYAVKCEESYLSKQNNLKRIEVQANPDGTSKYLLEEEETILLKEVEAPTEEECRRTLPLKGPFSPLETRVYSVLQNNGVKCNIDGTSVNTVLLDTDPSDPHERLLVAQHIGQNVDGTCLNLKHTTLMPNIRGFPALMTLIFCPTMQAKPSADGSRLAAILCGLGFEKINEQISKSLFPQHDVVLKLDTNITLDMINTINTIRHHMNEAIQYLEDLSEDRQVVNPISYYQEVLASDLNKLLTMNMESLPRVPVENVEIWNKFDFKGIILHTGINETGKEIWPLHSTIQLNEDNTETLSIKFNLAKLESMARREIDFEEIRCILCKEMFYNLATIRLHLISQNHKIKVDNFLSKKLN